MKKKTTGRPRLEVDLDLASRLASIMCTGQEIADVLQVSYDTVERRVRETFEMSFADWLKRHQAVGKSSLRRMQWKTAENGNVTMQIWLGKQYLGQVEKQEISVNGDMSAEISEKISQIKAKYNDKK